MNVRCADDVTGKGTSVVCSPACPRDLDMYEIFDEQSAIAKYGVNHIYTKWIDTDTVLGEVPLQVRSLLVAVNSADTG